MPQVFVATQEEELVHSLRTNNTLTPTKGP